MTARHTPGRFALIGALLLISITAPLRADGQDPTVAAVVRSWSEYRAKRPAGYAKIRTCRYHKDLYKGVIGADQIEKALADSAGLEPDAAAARVVAMMGDAKVPNFDGFAGTTVEMYSNGEYMRNDWIRRGELVMSYLAVGDKFAEYSHGSRQATVSAMSPKYDLIWLNDLLYTPFGTPGATKAPDQPAVADRCKIRLGAVSAVCATATGFVYTADEPPSGGRFRRVIQAGPVVVDGRIVAPRLRTDIVANSQGIVEYFRFAAVDSIDLHSVPVAAHGILSVPAGTTVVETSDANPANPPRRRVEKNVADVLKYVESGDHKKKGLPIDIPYVKHDLHAKPTGALRRRLLVGTLALLLAISGAVYLRAIRSRRQ